MDTEPGSHGSDGDWDGFRVGVQELIVCLGDLGYIKQIEDTYNSLVQLPGLSMRCPSLSNLKSSSTGMPGYGEPPRVKISHISTPNDQL